MSKRVQPRRFKVRWFYEAGGFSDDPDRWETQEEAKDYIAHWTEKYNAKRALILELNTRNTTWHIVFDTSDGYEEPPR